MGEFLQINTNVEQENRSTPMKGSSMRRRKCVVMNRIQYMGNVRSWYRRCGSGRWTDVWNGNGGKGRECYGGKMIQLGLRNSVSRDH